MNWFFAAAALGLLLWFFALFYLNYVIRQRTSPDHILSLLQEEVLQLEADIDEKTEQNLQLLEDRIQALRAICTEAERRIVVLGRELEKKEKEAQTLAALDRGRAVPAPAPPAERALASEVSPPAKKNKKSAAKSSPKTPKIVVLPQPPAPELPPVKERIAGLYRSGFSPEQIAKRLELTLGEVSLYVNLTGKSLGKH